MNEDEIGKKMDEVVELVRTDISSIRTGRATPSLVQDIVIVTYGGQQKMKIVELGTITTPDARTLVISPWDKSTIFDIKRGIEESKTGLNPAVDGEVIRISLPPMTSEDRQNYTRLLSQKLENGKIMIRRVRADAMEEVKRAFEAKEFGEDEKFRREKQIQEMIDEYVEKIDETGKHKEAELLVV